MVPGLVIAPQFIREREQPPVSGGKRSVSAQRNIVPTERCFGSRDEVLRAGANRRWFTLCGTF
jgi:hypothetical protein